MDQLNINNTVTLSNGVKMPVLGLGVWQIPEGEETEQAVKWALEAGYRHIDTAKFYKNEKSVGKAVRESGIPREEIFVTTKLWPTDFLKVEEAFNTSLEKLGLDYIDLYLIHWPISMVKNNIWKTFEKLYQKGKIKSIGVSNYSINDLESLMKGAEILPMVNQVHFNPFHNNRDVLKYCHKNNIAFEAYSPLTHGHDLDNSAITEISKKYNKSSAQIMLRWGLQKGTVIIPKSKSKNHIIENANIFDFSLSAEDMKILDTLDSH